MMVLVYLPRKDGKLNWHIASLNFDNKYVRSFYISGLAPMTESALSSLSPTAAATSSLLKSGMTLTQVYVGYMPIYSRKFINKYIKK